MRVVWVRACFAVLLVFCVGAAVWLGTRPDPESASLSLAFSPLSEPARLGTVTATSGQNFTLAVQLENRQSAPAEGRLVVRVPEKNETLASAGLFVRPNSIGNVNLSGRAPAAPGRYVLEVRFFGADSVERFLTDQLVVGG